MGTRRAPKPVKETLRSAADGPIIALAGPLGRAFGHSRMVPVHRFGRSRIVSAPPAARTDHGLFQARTPARPEGASFGAAGLIPGGVVYLGALRPPYARFDRRG